MYNCYQHGWRSEEFPCPSCHVTITTVGTDIPESPTPTDTGQGWTKQDVINAWNSAYGGDGFSSGEDYVESLNKK